MRSGRVFRSSMDDDVSRLTGSPIVPVRSVGAERRGAVQPLSFVRGLARAAQQAGARIFRNAPARSMQRDGATMESSTLPATRSARRGS